MKDRRNFLKVLGGGVIVSSVLSSDEELETDVLTYVLRGESKSNMQYEKIRFKDIKKGNKFVVLKPDGTPVPNMDGSLVCVADEDAHLTEYDGKKTYGVRATTIVEANKNETPAG